VRLVQVPTSVTHRVGCNKSCLATRPPNNGMKLTARGASVEARQLIPVLDGPEQQVREMTASGVSCSTSASLVAALLCASMAQGAGGGFEGPAPQALVTPHVARFVFSVPERASWSWNLPATHKDDLEYLWAIDVTNGGETYEFGFLLKFSDRSPASGDLQALLSAGQHSVAHVMGRGAQVVHDARVRAVIHERGIAIEVEDPETLRLLFSARPRRVVMKSMVPSRTKPLERQVEVRYEE
jgi:hypothetical protein